MSGRFAWRILAAVLVGAAACVPAARVSAGESTGFVPASPGSQLMLYVSRSIGLHGAGANRFGLRFERATPLSQDPAARYSAPLRHRTLIELQFARGMAPRMLFGPKVTWDMGRGHLGPTELAMASWTLAVPPPLAPLRDSVP
ncbi:MAG: hypothetical protein JSR15_00585 [Proteobacteria bacterium]|nr:hypothetical protein [Pseudomonadota bacterium]